VKLGKIIPEPSATPNEMFKVIRSNTTQELRRELLDCVQIWHLVLSYHVTDDTLQMFKVKGQGHGVK